MCSLDIVDFILGEFPEQVREEDVCYLQNEMVKGKFCKLCLSGTCSPF
jgi:hypothetical protein